MRLRICAQLLLGALAAPLDAAAQAGACAGDTLSIRPDSGVTSHVREVAPGVTYQCVLDRRGPWSLHLVRVDLRGPVTIDAMRATGRFLGRERVSDMAARWQSRGDVPLVGLNADFFNLRTGEITSTHVQGGTWVKGITRPDSVGPAVDDARSQVAVLADGTVAFGRFELHGEVVLGGRRIPLDGINAFPPGRLRGAVLFTSAYGDTVAADSTSEELRSRVVLQRLASAPDRERYRVTSLATGHEVVAIPRDGAVLVLGAIGVPSPRAGTAVTVRRTLGTAGYHPYAVVGGWGRLLVDGTSVAADLDRMEGTRPDFSAARHPRSAVGTSRDGRTLLLVVVDGRRPWSVGMSLPELARAMRELGAWNAINLDGGGSTALWVDGRVMNAPSDAAGERAVGNALWVLRTRGRSTR